MSASMSDELKTLLRESFEYSMADVHICLPGVIEKYDPKTRRASIQPSLKRKMPDGTFGEFPIIPDVPVQFPGTKKYTLHFPLEKGDEVAVHIIERGTDEWRIKGGKGIEEPDPRRFNLRDCYCVPGVQPVEFIPVMEDGLNIVHKTAHDGDLVSRITVDDAKVEVKYKEKADILIEEDHIMAKTENCTADLSGQKIQLEALQVEVTGGQFSMKGTVTPGTGPFCCLPNCLFTGAPHGGNLVAST